MLIADVTMREHMFEIAGERPQALLLHHQHGGRRDGLVLVVQQLRQRVFDIARPRAIHHVALANALLGGHLFDEQHHALARVAFEQVVQVFNGARSQPGIVDPQRMTHDRHVIRSLDQAEQRQRAIERARALLDERASQQAVHVKAAGHEQVVVQRHGAERARGLGVDVAGDDGAVDGQIRMRAAEPVQRRHGLEANEPVVLIERAEQRLRRTRETAAMRASTARGGGPTCLPRDRA